MVRLLRVISDGQMWILIGSDLLVGRHGVYGVYIESVQRYLTFDVVEANNLRVGNQGRW